MTIDLHIHSTTSDGIYSPTEIVEQAACQGLTCISLTDHDTVEGIEEAVRAAQTNGISFIPGIELTSMYKDEEIHILGYWIDPHNPILLDIIEKIHTLTRERFCHIISRLSKMGVHLTMEEVLAISGKGSMCRPHIAKLMMEKGYIDSVQEAFERYIGSHCPAYVSMDSLSPKELYQLILTAGGIPCIAHPGYLGRARMLTENDVLLHTEWGVMGIEVYHPRHDVYMRNYYTRVAHTFHLAITGGSDSHGRFFLQEDMKRNHVPDKIAEALYDLREKMNKASTTDNIDGKS